MHLAPRGCHNFKKPDIEVTDAIADDKQKTWPNYPVDLL